MRLQLKEWVIGELIPSLSQQLQQLRLQSPVRAGEGEPKKRDTTSAPSPSPYYNEDDHGAPRRGRCERHCLRCVESTTRPCPHVFSPHLLPPTPSQAQPNRTQFRQLALRSSEPPAPQPSPLPLLLRLAAASRYLFTEPR